MYLVRCSICRSCSLFGLSQPDDKVGKGIDPRVGKELTLIQSKRFSMKIAAAAILSWEGGVFNRFWWAINQHTSKEHAMGVSFHLCWAPTDQISDFYDLFSFKTSRKRLFQRAFVLSRRHRPNSGFPLNAEMDWAMCGWNSKGSPQLPDLHFQFRDFGWKNRFGGFEIWTKLDFWRRRKIGSKFSGVRKTKVLVRNLNFWSAALVSPGGPGKEKKGSSSKQVKNKKAHKRPHPHSTPEFFS